MWFQTPAGVGHLDPSVADILGSWDSVWYRRIAEGGYPLPLPADPDTGRLTYSAWAFYPGFPLLVRGLMLTGLPFGVAAVALNLALGALAVVLVWQALPVRAPRRPAARPRAPRAGGGLPLVPLPGDRHPPHALHRGAGLRAGRRRAAAAHAAALRRGGGGRPRARLHPGGGAGARLRGAGPPRDPVARGPRCRRAAAAGPARQRHGDAGGHRRLRRRLAGRSSASPAACRRPSSTCRPPGASSPTRARSCCG